MTYVVVPHAGTWIEIDRIWMYQGMLKVVPHAGTWIEIRNLQTVYSKEPVVPHAGTWIEIRLSLLSPEQQ